MKQQLAITLCFFTLLTGALTSCHSTHTTTRSQVASTTKATCDKPATPAQTAVVTKPDAHGSLLLETAYDWLGTPYLYGGNDRNGVDCSGFVLQVFLKATGVSLPRTSAQQAEWCRKTDAGALEIGDLVFFTGSDSTRVNHVGMYVGEGKMIHASSSRGVVIDPLDMAYWQKHLYSAGRVHGYTTQSIKPTAQNPRPIAQVDDEPSPEAIVKNAFSH